MKIVNGRWVNDQGDPLSNFDGSRLIELGKSVTSIFGKDITYERINIVSNLFQRDQTKENILNNILSDDDLFKKLSRI